MTFYVSLRTTLWINSYFIFKQAETVPNKGHVICPHSSCQHGILLLDRTGWFKLPLQCFSNPRLSPWHLIHYEMAELWELMVNAECTFNQQGVSGEDRVWGLCYTEVFLGSFARPAGCTLAFPKGKTLIWMNYYPCWTSSSKMCLMPRRTGSAVSLMCPLMATEKMTLCRKTSAFPDLGHSPEKAPSCSFMSVSPTISSMFSTYIQFSTIKFDDHCRIL